jgi:chromosomal replication initiation ATPase DnaA
MSPAKKVPLIVATVSEVYEVLPNVVCSKNPTDKNTMEARHVAMYIVRRHTTYTTRRISEIFGYSHNNAAIETIAAREQRENKLRLTIAAIEQKLQTKYKEDG